MGKSIEARHLVPTHAGHDGEATGAQDSSTTEFEAVGSLNFNVRDLDAEVSNTGAPTEALATEYEGSQGSETGEAAADLPAPRNALAGSYDGAEAFTEVIIGTDERVRVTATSVYPWRAICALRITAANGRQFIGSGWFIGPRTVMTAGHCLFLHNEGGWARSIEVIPGLNDATRPFGSARSSTLRSVNGWVASRNRDFDYGAIILPANARLGDRTGWFGFAARDDAFLRSAALNLSGYPGDKGGSQQWFMAQRARSLASRVITYDIDTMGGQSGSPVWVLQNGVRTAVGVHTNGASTGNSATRIHANVLANMVTWRNQGL